MKHYPAYTDRPWYRFFDPSAKGDVDVPEGSLSELLDIAAQKYGANCAVEFQNQKFTYGELLTKAEQLAAGLRALGVKRGDRVAIMLPNLPQTFIAFWGVQKAGAIAIMTNPLYMESELSNMVADAQPKVMIALDLFWSKLDVIKNNTSIQSFVVTRLSDALNFPLNWLKGFTDRRHKAFVKIPFDGKKIVEWKLLFTDNRINEPETDINEPAVIQYTGGTTGRAKGAMLTHFSFRANCAQMEMILSGLPEKNQIFLALLPLFHVFGLTVTMLLPTVSGAKVVPMPRYVPSEMLAAFKKYHFTAFLGAPSIFISLLQQKELKKYEKDLQNLSFCISGSAPLPQEWLTKFRDVTGTTIAEGYGLTEASPVTHVNPICGRQKIGSIGIPFPGTDAKIVSTDDGVTEMPVGEAGELWIKGPQVMRGYWNRPEETAQTLHDGWLSTGDIAVMDEDGYFKIVDRKKDLIIVGGYNVYPRDIDEVLVQHPKIKEAVAVGVNHRTRGEIIKAYVVLKDGETMTVPEVVAFCKQKLASYKVPKVVEFRNELPKSMVGKVLRRVLREEEDRKAAEEANSAETASGEHSE